jgi:hypothetical protein
MISSATCRHIHFTGIRPVFLYYLIVCVIIWLTSVCRVLDACLLSPFGVVAIVRMQTSTPTLTLPHVETDLDTAPVALAVGSTHAGYQLTSAYLHMLEMTNGCAWLFPTLISPSSGRHNQFKHVADAGRVMQTGTWCQRTCCINRMVQATDFSEFELQPDVNWM